MSLQQGTVMFNGVTIFKHNNATKGGALYAFRTVIYLNHVINFTSNFAQNGGAVYLDGFAYMSINLNTKFHSSFNTAVGYGGSIYQNDIPYPTQCQKQNYTVAGAAHCGIKIERRNTQINDWNVSSLLSYHDFAKKDGSFLYGGLLDRCYLEFKNGSKTEIWAMDAFLMKNHILTVVKNDANNVHAITSKPFALCFCDGKNSPDCSNSKSVLLYRPG